MIGLSIGCWLPALYGFSSIPPLQRTLTDMVELGPHLFRTPSFWLGVVMCAPVMALLLDFILSSWQRQRHPLDRQIFQVSMHLSAPELYRCAWHHQPPLVISDRSLLLDQSSNSKYMVCRGLSVLLTQQTCNACCSRQNAVHRTSTAIKMSAA